MAMAMDPDGLPMPLEESLNHGMPLPLLLRRHSEGRLRLRHGRGRCRVSFITNARSQYNSLMDAPAVLRVLSNVGGASTPLPDHLYHQRGAAAVASRRPWAASLSASLSSAAENRTYGGDYYRSSLASSYPPGVGHFLRLADKAASRQDAYACLQALRKCAPERSHERNTTTDGDGNDLDAPTPPKDDDMPTPKRRSPNALARANATDVVARIVATPFEQSAKTDPSSLRAVRREAVRTLRILCVSTAAREGAPEAAGAIVGIVPALFKAMADSELFEDAVYACEEVLAAGGAGVTLSLSKCAPYLRKLIVRLSPNKLAILCRVLAFCVVEPDAPAPGVTMWGDTEVEAMRHADDDDNDDVDDDDNNNNNSNENDDGDGSDHHRLNRHMKSAAHRPPYLSPPPVFDVNFNDEQRRSSESSTSTSFVDENNNKVNYADVSSSSSSPSPPDGTPVAFGPDCRGVNAATGANHGVLVNACPDVFERLLSVLKAPPEGLVGPGATAMDAAAPRVEALLVLCALCAGPERNRTQDELARLGLAKVLCTLFDEAWAPERARGGAATSNASTTAQGGTNAARIRPLAEFVRSAAALAEGAEEEEEGDRLFEEAMRELMDQAVAAAAAAVGRDDDQPPADDRSADDALHGPNGVHGPGCTCDPVSAIKVQILRLAHNFCDRGCEDNSANKAALVAPQGGPRGNLGFIGRVVDTLLQSRLDAPPRFWLASCCEAFLRGSDTTRRELVAKRGLLEHLASLASDAAAPAAALQATFDLLGELVRGHGGLLLRLSRIVEGKTAIEIDKSRDATSASASVSASTIRDGMHGLEAVRAAATASAPRRGRSILPRTTLEALASAASSRLVDSNVFLRALWLSFDALEMPMRGEDRDGDGDTLASATASLRLDDSPSTSTSTSTLTRTAPSSFTSSATLVAGIVPGLGLSPLEAEELSRSRLARWAGGRRLPLLRDLMGAVLATELSQESMCVANTALAALLLSARRGSLEDDLSAVRRLCALELDAVPQGDAEADELSRRRLHALTNFRGVLDAWRRYYARRGRDRDALRRAGGASFEDWWGLVARLAAPAGPADSLTTHINELRAERRRRSKHSCSSHRTHTVVQGDSLSRRS